MTFEEKKRVLEQALADIETALPAVIFRNWKRWADIIPISPRSVANDDSAGIGPSEKIYVGRVTGYTRRSFMNYLRGKSRLA